MDNSTKIEILKTVAAEIGAKWYGNAGYCGRGMVGKHCAAIVCERGDENDIVLAAATRHIKGARIDNLGMRSIVYWPSVEITP